MLAQWHDIHLAFPDKQVLHGVSLTVHPGDRVALVGENGSGKTCLFRILLGQLAPTGGAVYLKQGIRIGYLTQHLIDLAVDESTTCWDVAASPFAEVMALERFLATHAAALAEADESEIPALLARFGAEQERFEQLGGYTYRTRVEAMLSGLGLPPKLWDTKVRHLSAGQKVRLALARLLLADYDLLLLDEPTNHLDLDARAWLAQHLRSIDTAYVVVSHDRRFLDAVADKVAHLDRGKLTLYTGTYSQFRRQLEEQTEQAWKVYEKRQKVVRKLEEQARNYKTWSERTERTKRGAYDKGYIGHKAAKLARRSIQARRRLEETIERMKMEKPFVADAIAIDFHGSEGRNLLRTEGLAVGYVPGKPLAEGISFRLRAGERVAVTGPNGSGKSTLLRTVLGLEPPLAGEVWISPAADIGYFDQDARSILGAGSALEAVLAVASDETLARTVLGRMRVQKETVTKPVQRLSAGERAKVLLARLILGRHNLLILDEPTNHLDIETQDVLLDALADFPGGILFVSHDRHFVETLASEVLELEDLARNNRV